MLVSTRAQIRNLPCCYHSNALLPGRTLDWLDHKGSNLGTILLKSFLEIINHTISNHGAARCCGPDVGQILAKVSSNVSVP